MRRARTHSWMIEIIAVTCLLVSCSQGGDGSGAVPQDESSGPPETQPTPIVGSGLIFTFAEGEITCLTNYQNNPLLIQCYAAMPSSATGNGLIAFEGPANALTNAETLDIVTGFETAITSHVWLPLDISAADSVAQDSVMQVTADGITVVYTLPEGLGTISTTATLQIEEVNGITTLQKNVNFHNNTLQDF